MAELLTTTDELTSVAEAIRDKTGKTDKIVYPNGFVSEINSIETYKKESSVPANKSTSIIIVDDDYYVWRD